jgi:hypothetical protein
MGLKEKHTPESFVPTRNRVINTIGVASCILKNVDQGRICTMNVARWDISFGTAIRLKGMVLVHLEGNYCRTKVKHNHPKC